MDFLRILKSFEEFLYEAMTWLVFYPRTMWRAVTRPAAMMDYARTELRDDLEDQYKDTISPPLSQSEDIRRRSIFRCRH